VAADDRSAETFASIVTEPKPEIAQDGNRNNQTHRLWNASLPKDGSDGSAESATRRRFNPEMSGSMFVTVSEGDNSAILGMDL